MCLVSYIPGQNGVYITSNRDESPLRGRNVLTTDSINGTRVLYPKDMAGGSWFLTSASGHVFVVLNGAFVKHKRQLPYRMSRGIMIKKILEFDSVKAFVRDFNFTGIEPFTIVLFHKDQLLELRWDGSHRFIEILNPTDHHVWSSCTLYDDETAHLREQIFKNQLNFTRDLTAQSVRQIHLTGKTGEEANDFVMNRKDIVKTISVTQAEISDRIIDVKHYDLLSGSMDTHCFERG